jgi:ABC-type Zn uptake system ZnuABC Zn-binding protein ZnuA
LFLLIHTGVWAGNYKKAVATSTWTAAYAYAAGFENVAILAPANMLHPSEYELTPKEIKLLLNADLIVYAGYEVMSKFIENELKDSKVECVKIETNYNLNKIETSVNLLGPKEWNCATGTIQFGRHSAGLSRSPHCCKTGTGRKTNFGRSLFSATVY